MRERSLRKWEWQRNGWVKTGEIKVPAYNKNLLVGFWDQDGPVDDLHDIQCGKYLAAMSNLPHSTRQLIEDSDLHVELTEVDNRYRVSKIVKKRDVEFDQGKEKFFTFDQEGKRIPIDEEEYNRAILNKEDLYSGDVELESFESMYSAPMDKWDIVFDETNFLSEAKSFIESWNNGFVDKKNDPTKMLEMLYETEVYSSDWFPYRAEKQFHSKEAKQIAEQLLNGTIFTKAQLGAAIGPRQDNSKSIIGHVSNLRKQASECAPGKKKAELLIKASKIMLKLGSDRRNYKGKLQTYIGDSDRRKLWSLWEKMQAERHGIAKLAPWKFEKVIAIRLQKQILDGCLTAKQADQRLKEIVNKVYPKHVVGKVGTQYIDYVNKIKSKNMDNILEKKEEVQDEDCFTPIDWLPSEIELVCED